MGKIDTAEQRDSPRVELGVIDSLLVRQQRCDGVPLLHKVVEAPVGDRLLDVEDANCV